ncbi:MAG: hypothetical protein IJS82_03875 [Paludibacteraceae bacterium]|nr:hypothetical protein [Paludibacteraceae bacterium]
MNAFKFFILAFCATIFVACEETIGDASLIEGGWELQKTESDATVYADYTGETFFSDQPFTHTYENKEMIWLFYEGSISQWSQATDDEGNVFWEGYSDDASHTYVVEGKSPELTIVETTLSIIPGMERTSAVTRYHVEKLSKSQMVLTTTATPYISEKDSTVDVHVIYTFQRENTILAYFKQFREQQILPEHRNVLCNGLASRKKER